MFDEAHQARNPKTTTFKALTALNADSKWGITGTPIMNYTADIRILSQLCTPWFPMNIGNSLQEEKWKKMYLLRRNKSDVLSLPQITKQDVWLEFSDEERKEYGHLESEFQKMYFGSAD